MYTERRPKRVCVFLRGTIRCLREIVILQKTIIATSPDGTANYIAALSAAVKISKPVRTSLPTVLITAAVTRSL
jgi:hypothetical protein